MLRDITGRVGLDEEVEVAGLVITGNGGVGSDDFFLGIIWLGKGGCDGDVLADWETEDGRRGWETESVASSVKHGILGFAR